MKREVVAHKDPKSPISEIFRTLRTNIQFINTNKKIQTLLITSTLPGEGKSWIASNLAVTFAQTGKKVVLIDADMRKGRQHIIFATTPAPGLSNFLSKVGSKKHKNDTEEVTDCIRKTEVPNLYIMPTGNIPPNPSELLVSPKMLKLLEKFKTVFDIVIIDGTPCELVTDAVILSRIVDSTIIVTAHKVTKKDTLDRVIKNIQNVGGNLAGVVINKIPISGKKYEERCYYYEEYVETEKDKRKKKNDEIERLLPAPMEIKVEEPSKQKTTKKTTKKKKRTKSTSKKTVESKPTKTNQKRKIPSINRTEDILKQMNEYLDKEKTKTEKGEQND